MTSAPTSQRTLTNAPAPSRLPHIETLRGIAATMVFVCHALAFTFAVDKGTSLARLSAWIGYSGVAIFFVISGFVLYRPFLTARERGARVNTTAYLIRRTLRIFPLYWFVLIVFCRFGEGWGLDRHHGLWYLFLLHIYRPDLVFAGGLGVSWTLAIEVTFYLALPPLAWLLVRAPAQSAWPFVGLFALSVLYRLIQPAGDTVLLGGNLIGYIGLFAAGMLLANISRLPSNHRLRRLAQWPADHRSVAIAAIFGVLGLLAMWQIRGVPAAPGARVASVLAYLAAVFIGLVAVATAAFASPKAANAAGEFLGRISYGIYLWNLPVLLVGLGVSSLPNGLEALVKFVIVLALSTITYYMIESPAIALGRRLSRRFARPKARIVASQQASAA